MGWRSAYTRILERGDPLGLTYASLKQVEAAMLEMRPADRIAFARELLKETGRVVAVVPEKKDPATTLYISNEALAQDRNPSDLRRRMVADANWAAGQAEGWNACRAKMLEDEG